MDFMNVQLVLYVLHLYVLHVILVNDFFVAQEFDQFKQLAHHKEGIYLYLLGLVLHVLNYLVDVYLLLFLDC